MGIKSTKPGRAAKPEIADPTIAQAVAKYLDSLPARRRRTAGWALELLAHCLNGYADEALTPSEQKRFRRWFDAEDETHREYCEIFGPDRIAPALPSFFEWFLIRKVMARPKDLQRIASEVGPFMTWLGTQGLIEAGAAAEGARLASLAAEIIPRAETAASRLRDHLERRLLSPEGPEEAVIEGRFRIVRAESAKLWLEAEEDGRTYGPVSIPVTIGKKLTVGWTLSGVLAPSRRGARLLEVWNVYPSLAAEGLA